MLKILSRGMQRLDHLDLFLQEEFARFADPAKLQAVAGWGHKPTADKARKLSLQAGVPYLAVEDGMLRSLDLGVRGAAPLSLSIDPVGCYYDCSSTSLIEQLLADDTWYDRTMELRIRDFISFILQ